MNQESTPSEKNRPFLEKVTIAIVALTVFSYFFPKTSFGIYKGIIDKLSENETASNLKTDIYSALDLYVNSGGNSLKLVDMASDQNEEHNIKENIDSLVQEIRGKYNFQVIYEFDNPQELEALNKQPISSDDYPYFMIRLEYIKSFAEIMGPGMENQSFMSAVIVHRNSISTDPNLAGTDVVNRTITFPLYYNGTNGIPEIRRPTFGVIETMVHEISHLLISHYDKVLIDQIVAFNVDGFNYLNDLCREADNHNYPGFASKYGYCSEYEDTATIIEHFIIPSRHDNFMNNMSNDSILKNKFDSIYNYLIEKYGIDLWVVYNNIEARY